MQDLLKNEIENIKKLVENNFPIIYSVNGKFIRSYLTILLMKSLKINISKDDLKLLAIIELIHNASLFHDDVIDEEDVRRKELSFNKKYGNKKSVLYGNIVLSNAINLLLDFENVEMLNFINKTVKNMCLGEILQNDKLYKTPTIQEYLEKTKLKTASLFSATVYLMSFRHKEIPVNLITDFAEKFGIAFQIKNDLKDIKKDIEKGIYTAPVIYANSVNFDKVSIEKTHSLIDNYTRRVLKSLENIEESKYKNTLIGEIKCLSK